MSSDLDEEYAYTIFLDTLATFTLPTYTTVPDCAYDFTYYLSVDDKLIQTLAFSEEY